MVSLGFFLAGALVGAACMWCSNKRAFMAAENERRLAESRETKLAKEREACRSAGESWRLQLMDMQIEQANSAGYLDGYNACCRDMENRKDAGYAIDTIAQGLRDGKRVFWTVINH